MVMKCARDFGQNKKTKDVPVIFLTAKTEKDDIVKGFEVGGQDYITKHLMHVN